MITVNTHEAKSRLSELIRMAESGEDVVVARSGKAVAKIIAWPPERPDRRFGTWEGRVEGNLDDLVESDADVASLFDDLRQSPE